MNNDEIENKVTTICMSVLMILIFLVLATVMLNFIYQGVSFLLFGEFKLGVLN